MRTHIYKKSKTSTFQKTPITEETFERQGWDKHVEESEEGDFYYFTLPLPKNNPDPDSPILISSTNYESELLGLMSGNYMVEIADFFGLGSCYTEEELDTLYYILTRSHIDKK